MIEQQTYPSYTSKFPELAFYGFPGATSDTRSALDQIKYGDQLGIGNVMISERPDYKEVATMCGAVAAVTENVYIGTSATNANRRHMLTLGAMCSSINRLSRGRFALGLGKGNGMERLGLARNTYQHEREYMDVVKRLLRGETIENYSGVIGDFPQLCLGDYVNEDIPIMFIGFGPKSLKHAGTIYDGAHLHTFMAPDVVRKSVDLVREGEAEAGREVGKAKVWTVLATLCNPTEETYLKTIIARHASYLQAPVYGDTLAKVNGWDAEELERFRQHPAMKSVNGIVDSVATMKQIEAIEKILPEDWRSAAVGTPAECAKRWVEDFEAGASGVIIHGSSPEEFEPILAEYEKIRPSHLFEGRTNRPG